MYSQCWFVEIWKWIVNWTSQNIQTQCTALLCSAHCLCWNREKYYLAEVVTRRLSTFTGDKPRFHYTVSTTQYLDSEWRGDHDNWSNYRPRLDTFLSPGTRGHGMTLDTGHIVNTRHHWPTFPACGSPLPPPANQARRGVSSSSGSSSWPHFSLSS